MQYDDYQFEGQQKRRGGGGLFLLLCILLAAGGWYWWRHHKVAGSGYPPGSEKAIVIPSGLPNVISPPLQHPVSLRSFILKGFTVTPVASYVMTARILGIENYYMDRQSDLSPVDLALGWALMSNKKVLSKISISQNGRFYHWNTDDYPLEREQIESMSANTHIIPASKRVEDQLGELDEGQIVTLGGYLVNVSKPDGFYWNTSLNREDTGNGACEIFYVQYIVPQARG